MCRQIAFEVVAFSYHLFSGTPISFISLRITSLHLLRGSPLGRAWGSQLNKLIFGTRLLGIRATWPSHARRRCFTPMEIVFKSPHLCLTSKDEICWAHCILLEMPSMVRMHLWWKESNFLSYFWRGIQHSDP